MRLVQNVVCPLLVLLVFFSFIVRSPHSLANEVYNPPQAGGPSHELHLGRLVYQHGLHSSWGPGRAWWRIDWPEAEFHFVNGVKRYTAIDVAGDSVHVSLLDDEIFDYPWLFVQQVGRWQLSASETERLGEYLSRGGFLVVDDFHGPAQWRVFTDTIARALPGHTIVDIDSSHELMHIHYELSQDTQIPGRRHIRGVRANGTAVVDMPHSPATWRGVYDSDGRLMVAINFNMDMGDAWEHADDPAYPLPMTSLAYQFGINYLVYALTH